MYKPTHSLPVHYSEIIDELYELYNPAASSLWKERLFPFGQEAGWPHNQSGRHGGKENPVSIRNPTPTLQPFSQ
jgi:hypothetical protein